MLVGQGIIRSVEKDRLAIRLYHNFDLQSPQEASGLGHVFVKRVGKERWISGDEVVVALDLLDDDLYEPKKMTKVVQSDLDIKAFIGCLKLDGVSFYDLRKMYSSFGREIFHVARAYAPKMINYAPKGDYSISSVIKVASYTKKIEALYRTYSSLISSSMPAKQVQSLVKRYGFSLVNIMSEKPYYLVLDKSFKGKGFGVDIQKIKGALTLLDKAVHNFVSKGVNVNVANKNFYVTEAILRGMGSQGSTAFSIVDVSVHISKILDISFADAERVLSSVLKSTASKVIESDSGAHFVSPIQSFSIEESIVDMIRERIVAPDILIKNEDLEFEDYYTDEQRLSIKKAIQKSLSLITGGAGTGKTTVIKGVIKNIKKVFGQSSEILLCSPTGKASQRMTEATGIQAVTIHSLLKYNKDSGFMEAEIPDNVSAVIVDEASMVDSALMMRVMSAIPKSVKLILVADVQQLPSIKQGQPFKDMLLSGIVPSVRLSATKRTSEGSYITHNANKIINGVMPSWGGGVDDFHVLETSSDAHTADVIKKILSEDLMSKFGVSLKDTQVISPKREPNGKVGITPLNKLAQQLLTGDCSGSGLKSRFNIGDKVVYGKNNYNLKLFNGDVGFVKSVSDSVIEVDVEGVGYSISESDARYLDLAHALSVHKTQGSEYDLVIMPLSKRHQHMLTPELMYTAVTRAKKHFVFVGDSSVIRSGLENKGVNTRDTYLGVRLKQLALELRGKMESDISNKIERSITLSEIEEELSEGEDYEWRFGD